jgi:DNA polymerase sigma
MNKNLFTGKNSKEKQTHSRKHENGYTTKEEDVQFLGKKRKSDNSKDFKLLFPKSDLSENDDFENLLKLNQILDADDDDMDKSVEDINEVKINKLTTQAEEDKAKKKELLSLDFISFTKPEKVDKPVLPRVYDKNFPWLSRRTRKLKGILKLDSEIHDFYNFIKPTDVENLLREKTFDTIRDVISKINPEWKVKKFGSFPNQIHLPDSDIDLIILTNTNTDPLKILNKISKKLIDSGCIEYINVIQARIPIIRATLKDTKVNVDIR